MRNGLYSIHVHMLDGVKGRDSGVIILRDGKLLGGGPYFWWTGSYTVGKDRTWKGELTTKQHTPSADPSIRPLFGGHEVTSGFSGTFTDDEAEVYATALVGTKSVGVRATLKRLSDE
jgi:T3SS negative regulator,GrlR